MVVSIIVLIFLGVGYIHTTPSPGLVDDYYWQGFQWIQNNTPTNSRIFYFYSPTFDQSATISNAKRDTYIPQLQHYFASATTNNISRIMYTHQVRYDVSGLPHRLSFFSFDYYLDKDPSLAREQYRDICTFDYIVFDGSVPQQELRNYNFAFAQRLVNHTFTGVYQNARMIVLKNNNKGAECLD